MPTLARYPVALGVATASILAAFYYATGNLPATSGADEYWMSPLALTGMSLMLVLLPAYILTANLLCMRRSISLVEELKPLLPDPSLIEPAVASIREAVRRNWPTGVAVGIVLGLVNAATPSEIIERDTLRIDVPLALGQYILWISVALAATVRISAARQFRDLGELVEIDLFQIERMRPIAHSGLVDVVLVAGGIALTPLQSLDAEFRWENYQFPVLLLVPATMLLLVWPLRPIHRRLREEKHRLLAAADALVARARSGRSAAEVIEFETLLAYRDRVRNQRTWALDVPLLSRFALYIVIPVVAWVGAALVEIAIDRWAGS